MVVSHGFIASVYMIVRVLDGFIPNVIHYVIMFVQRSDAHPLGGVAPLCRNCQPKEAEIYISKLDEVNVHQRVYNALWTECQRCQGSYHQEVRFTLSTSSSPSC